MRKIALAIAILGTTLLPVLFSAPAHAQATRTWVSGVGDDANPCSRTAPCKTFAGAISKTAVNGEINCLDPAGFGAVTITKGITLDCHEVYGSILVAGTNGVVINAAGAVVTIRNLNFDGTNTGLRGISIVAASKVNIEDCMVMQFTQQGIADVRTGAGNVLSIRNATIRNNTGAAISAAAGTTSGTSIEGSLLVSNGFGLAVATGNNVIIRGSVLSANTTSGIQVDPGGQVFADNDVITFNGTGVGASGTVALANSDITFNTTAINGATTSFGNNRIFGNAGAGTTPTLGTASTDHGQQ
jgi:Right handed beta helix region